MCLDDILKIWKHGKKEFQKFLGILISYHDTIKFTANYSRQKIRFLGVEVIKKRNQLMPDLYIKPSDTQKYLQNSSCYVFHSKKSIPYSQAFRSVQKKYFLKNDVTI